MDTHVTGTVATFRHVYVVQGEMRGHRFKLFSLLSDAKPEMAGDVLGNELHPTRDVAHRALKRPLLRRRSG
jgi:hypothetical protein